MFGSHLHAKRIESLANGTLGVMSSASLAVSVVGQALAQARGLLTKHAVKQVDRLLSNKGVRPWDLFAHWVPEVVGDQRSLVVAMDWTDFDADGQATLALNLVTGHGRATPLLWLTMLKDELTGRRNDIEDACLARLSEVLPAAARRAGRSRRDRIRRFISGLPAGCRHDLPRGGLMPIGLRPPFTRPPRGGANHAASASGGV
jgi:hypothetical protein